MSQPVASAHVISVRGVWCGDGTADVRIECGGCDWFVDLRYPTVLEHVTALGNGHLMMAAADAGREVVLQEAAITADGWCAAHHCFRPECSERTHVHTVRLLNGLWERVAATAAARGMDTNAGVTAALEAWASESG